jgi:hypothetical protein
MTAAPEPPLDDLGHPVPAARPVRRVVSLVPTDEAVNRLPPV